MLHKLTVASYKKTTSIASPTIKPGALELRADGDGGAAHQDGLRAQKVNGSGRVEVVF